MANRVSTFTPTVAVHDDGLITVDWTDSFVSTEGLLDSGLYSECEEAEEHYALLDEVLGLPAHFTPWQRLHRLADYMARFATETGDK